MATIVKEVGNLGINATVASASAGALSQIFGYGSPVPIFGYNVPSSLIFALVGGGASLAQKASRDAIIPMVFGKETIAPQTLSYIVSPLITAGLFVGLDVGVNLATGADITMNNVVNMAVVGAVSQLIANSLEAPVHDVIEII